MRRVVIVGAALVASAGLAVFTLTRPDRASLGQAANPQPVRPGAIPPRPEVPAKLGNSLIPETAGLDTASLRSRMFAAAPADAIEILSRLVESPENNKQILEYLEHLASKGDWEAIKLAAVKIADGPGLWGGMKHASRTWAGVDPKGLIAWSDTLSSEGLRQHVGLGISNYLLNQPPEQVAALTRAFLEYTEDETLSRRLYGIALNQMLQTDSPDQAVEWALQIRDNESSDAMLFDKISDDAAKRFLQALYDRGSTERADNALPRYVEASTHRNPENTANWALEIQDPRTKKRALQQAVMTWGVRDKPGARSWVQANAQKLDANALLRMVDSLPDRP